MLCNVFPPGLNVFMIYLLHNSVIPTQQLFFGSFSTTIRVSQY